MAMYFGATKNVSIRAYHAPYPLPLAVICMKVCVWLAGWHVTNTAQYAGTIAAILVWRMTCDRSVFGR